MGRHACIWVSSRHDCVWAGRPTSPGPAGAHVWGGARICITASTLTHCSPGLLGHRMVDHALYPDQGSCTSSARTQRSSSTASTRPLLGWFVRSHPVKARLGPALGSCSVVLVMVGIDALTRLVWSCLVWFERSVRVKARSCISSRSTAHGGQGARAASSTRSLLGSTRSAWSRLVSTSITVLGSQRHVPAQVVEVGARLSCGVVRARLGVIVDPAHHVQGPRPHH
jgi:hypothetical protein